MKSEQQTEDASGFGVPSQWDLGRFDPNAHLLNLKGKEYLPAQYRLAWFIRDQRSFIARGLAKFPYVVHTEIVEIDRERGFAHFKTYVRDVLGNEATMYGSETAKDFGDYAEKASTKSMGRALLALGYGTAFALEMDEGERVADGPVERSQQPAQTPRPSHASAPMTPIRPGAQSQQVAPAGASAAAPAVRSEPATRESREERTRAAGEAPFAIAEMDKQVADPDSQRALAKKLLTYFGADETGEHKPLRAWLGAQMGLPGPVGIEPLRLLGRGEHTSITRAQLRKVVAELAAREAEQHEAEEHEAAAGGVR